MSSIETYKEPGKLQQEVMEIIRTVRQNHALEHATITLLLPRLESKTKLVGRAGPNGFHIYGNVPTDLLEETAREALRRLQNGEESLAVSPLCGTNLVVTGLAAAVASMIAGRGHRGFGKFVRVAEASIIAAVIAQPLGRLAQKHLTTTADLDDVEITSVIRLGHGKTIRHKVEVNHY